MEDLPDALLAEIVKRITTRSDLNSLSLVSKRLYTIDAEQKGAIRVGCGLCPATEVMASLCSRFSNLWKVEVNYWGWRPDHGIQIDNQGLHVLSSHCSSLTDLTLSHCSYINDTGLGCLAYCKKLMSLRLNYTPEITSSGLLSVAVGCKNLCALHLIGYNGIIGSTEWLKCLGSLEELVVKNCRGIGQFDILKFGPGWMKLQKFEFQIRDIYNLFRPRDPSYVANFQYRYDFCCERLKDLTLTRILTELEIGLRCLLRKCKGLEKVSLNYIVGLYDSDMITISQNCSNLRSITLRLMPLCCAGPSGRSLRTPLTDDSLKALALSCRMLQAVELTFLACDSAIPEIGFTQDGLVMLFQSCPICDLVLCGANCFNDQGMKALSSAQFLESLELMDCIAITDAGMRLLAHSPSLINLTLRQCNGFTDVGVGEVVRARKLESLVVEGCRGVSLKAVQGSAKSVHYKVDSPGYGLLERA